MNSDISEDEFAAMETICLNGISENSFHSYMSPMGKNNCKGTRIKLYSHYDRNLITAANYKSPDTLVKIPVFYCEVCGRFHAVLPCCLFVPYCQYSILFILRVLYEMKHTDITISDLSEKYNIAIATIYRWYHRYHKVLTMYVRACGKTISSFFLDCRDDFMSLCCDYFTLCNAALFETDRRLHPS